MDHCFYAHRTSWIHPDPRNFRIYTTHTIQKPLAYGCDHVGHTLLVYGIMSAKASVSTMREGLFWRLFSPCWELRWSKQFIEKRMRQLRIERKNKDKRG
jgi:hypothetical protein